ncbi:hypothetical protein ACNHUS_04495 [Actinomycetes bacterium M1A6_2h]
MKLATAVISASAAATLLLTGCSSDDQQSASDTANNLLTSANNAAGGVVSSVESAAPGVKSSAASVAENAGGLFDDAKGAAFVAAYKAQFSSLADGKSDDDIKGLLTTTCQQISDGADESAVVTSIEQNAANNGTAPSADDAKKIYDQAKIACP